MHSTVISEMSKVSKPEQDDAMVELRKLTAPSWSAASASEEETPQMRPQFSLQLHKETDLAAKARLVAAEWARPTPVGQAAKRDIYRVAFLASKFQRPVVPVASPALNKKSNCCDKIEVQAGDSSSGQASCGDSCASAAKAQMGTWLLKAADCCSEGGLCQDGCED